MHEPGAPRQRVNHALAVQAARERRLMMLSKLVSDYEAKHGAITEDELARQQRTDRRSAIVVRGRKRGLRRTKSA